MFQKVSFLGQLNYNFTHHFATCQYNDVVTGYKESDDSEKVIMEPKLIAVQESSLALLNV